MLKVESEKTRTVSNLVWPSSVETKTPVERFDDEVYLQRKQQEAINQEGLWQGLDVVHIIANT